jgi:putative transposase
MRKTRAIQKGAKYHVYSRINKNENIMKSDDVKNLFLNTIKRAKKKYNFSIKNFVIMNSYFDFIIQPREDESLSRIMQWILSVFAMNYNKTYKSFDHVWKARFWSKIIDDIKQLFDVFYHISNKPVIFEMAIKAKDYKFGGLYFILQKNFDIVEMPEHNYKV